MKQTDIQTLGQIFEILYAKPALPGHTISMVDMPLPRGWFSHYAGDLVTPREASLQCGAFQKLCGICLCIAVMNRRPELHGQLLHTALWHCRGTLRLAIRTQDCTHKNRAVSNDPGRVRREQ